jgi:hypothetical protein
MGDGKTNDGKYISTESPTAEGSYPDVAKRYFNLRYEDYL